ncbi:MAG: hypothetical protein AAGU21_01100 [Solidesulfovibrio sp.]|uniref:hypothetical protein n=1 Tax=Solidesulfovibrio sp. TaxID=2910990 RepID=UPI002B2210A7|nr:hypothetical protein [Solidesulfovibrio sp.]MEA4857918.1 hypothetical protein [Solidesulfovibrio sp.]
MVWSDRKSFWTDRPLAWLDQPVTVWTDATVSAEALAVALAFPEARVRIDAAADAPAFALGVALPGVGVSISTAVAVDALSVPLGLPAVVGAVSATARAASLALALVLGDAQAFTGIGDQVRLVSVIGPRQVLASSLERTAAAGEPVRLASPFNSVATLESPFCSMVLLRSGSLRAQRE